MSFALYLIGFAIFIAGVAWAMSTVHIAPLYIAITCVILFGLGIVMGVSRTRAKDPPKA